MYHPELVIPADVAVADEQRLSTEDISELQKQYNANGASDEFAEVWLEESETCDLRHMDEEDFFDTFCGNI